MQAAQITQLPWDREHFWSNIPMTTLHMFFLLFFESFRLLVLHSFFWLLSLHIFLPCGWGQGYKHWLWHDFKTLISWCWPWWIWPNEAQGNSFAFCFQVKGIRTFHSLREEIREEQLRDKAILQCRQSHHKILCIPNMGSWLSLTR